MHSRSIAAVISGMMMMGWISAAAAIAAPSTLPTLPPPFVQESSDEIAKLIAHIDDDNATVRRRAGLLLKNCSAQAFAPVEKSIAAGGHTPAGLALLQEADAVLAGRDKVARRAAGLLPWLDDLLARSYRNGGRANPKWDEAALKLIHDWPRLLIISRVAPEQLKTLSDGFHKLMDQGCDDPMFKFLALRVDLKIPGNNMQAVTSKAQAALTEVIDGKYPERLKFYLTSDWLEANNLSTPALVDKCISWTPGLISADETDSPALPPDALKSMIMKLSNQFEHTQQAQTGIKQLYPAYSKAHPKDVGPDLFLANCYVERAWELRGGDVAVNVGQEQWKGFEENLKLSQTEFEKVYTADPDESIASRQMIIVCKGTGAPLDEMNKWFERAMKADPDDYSACMHKVDYLLPRWHGSHQQMIAFGRECFEKDNWRGRISFALIDAHLAVAQEMPDSKAYLARADVYADIKSDFEEMLDLYPDWVRMRSTYAKLAADAGQWSDAHKQFELVGDHPIFSAPINADPQLYQQLRKEAAAKSPAN